MMTTSNQDVRTVYVLLFGTAGAIVSLAATLAVTANSFTTLVA